METNFQWTNNRQPNTINIYLETDFLVSNNHETNYEPTYAIQLHMEANISYANYKIANIIETNFFDANNG